MPQNHQKGTNNSKVKALLSSSSSTKTYTMEKSNKINSIAIDWIDFWFYFRLLQVCDERLNVGSKQKKYERCLRILTLKFRKLTIILNDDDHHMLIGQNFTDAI